MLIATLLMLVAPVFCRIDTGSGDGETTPSINIGDQGSGVGKTTEQPINECLTDNGGCDHICTDTPEWFVCSCNSGYQLNGDGYACDDIDECALGTDKCAQICTNTVGSYNCSCRRHYHLAGNAFSCNLVCDGSFLKFGDACFSFKLPEKPVSQSSAHTMCARKNARLAYFKDDAEFTVIQKFILSFMSSDRRHNYNYWIGARETGPRDVPTWTWYPNSTHEVALTSSWHPRRPHHQQRCGTMYGAADYKLVDVACSPPVINEHYGWICRVIL